MFYLLLKSHISQSSEVQSLRSHGMTQWIVTTCLRQVTNSFIFILTRKFTYMTKIGNSFPILVNSVNGAKFGIMKCQHISFSMSSPNIFWWCIGP